MGKLIVHLLLVEATQQAAHIDDVVIVADVRTQQVAHVKEWKEEAAQVVVVIDKSW